MLLFPIVSLSPFPTVSTSLFSISSSLLHPENRFTSFIFLDSVCVCVCVWMYNICFSLSDLLSLYNRLWAHPPKFNWLTSIPFYGSVIFHRVYVSQLPYPFICWWKYRLLPCPQFSSVQFSHSDVSDSLWNHGLRHARITCPSPTPGTCSNSCP